MVPVLGYWKIRGLGQPIRLLLEYVGDIYEEKRYDHGEFQMWMKEKFNLGLDLPNLPYYIDGDLKLTQSLAILRYIADKHKMLGNNPQERARVSMIEGAVMDMRIRLAELAYHANYTTFKITYLADLPAEMKLWSEILGDNLYLNQSTPTHIDFMLYETLTSIRYLEPECMNKFPNLEKFCHRIEALPNIKAYMESKKFIRWPLHGSSAHFGGYGQASPL